MFNNYGFEELEHDELLEGDEGFEYDEASRRPRRPRVPTAKHGNPMPKQPGQGYASKAEVHALAQRLDGRIATNSKAIGTVDNRVRAIESDQSKLRAEVKREITERKTATDGLKKSVDDMRQLSLLLPLLSTQSTVPFEASDHKTYDVVVDSGDSFSKILPILLLSGGLGGSSSGSGSSGLFGGGDGGIATLALMMALISSKK